MIEKLSVEKYYEEKKTTRFKETSIITVFLIILLIIASISIKLTNYKNNLFKIEKQKINLSDCRKNSTE